MRILHLGKHYPPSYGGIETVLQNIVEGFLDSGHEVMVLASGNSTLESREVITGPRSGRTGTLVRLANLGNWNSQPLTLNMVSSLRRAVARFQPDLVHMHLPNPLVAAAWLIWQKLTAGPKPVLAISHYADISQERRGRMLVRPFVTACLRQARGICASSQALVESSETVAAVRDKVETIPFGIADPGCPEVPGRTFGPFLFVGRLVAYKGLRVLLEAMAETPSAELDIVGSGPEENELRRFVQTLALGGRVRFHGNQSDQNLRGFYAGTRALVLPSIDARETFGMVQLEAMAAGVAVIATDLPTGVAEVGVAGKTTIIVPPSDSRALAGALQELQQDTLKARRMGQAGRSHFLDNYTRERMIENLTRWYESLMTISKLEVL